MATEEGKEAGSDMTEATRESVSTRERRGSWMLSRPWRRTVLIVHITFAGAWIGVDVMVAALVLVGWFSPRVELRALAYRSLANFVVVPMGAVALVSLLSGLLLGLGTTWGLIRYWWVLIKLAVNLALCIAIVVVFPAGLPEVDRYGAALPTGTADADRIATLFYPPAVSLTALTFAVVLAVVRPWGRIHRREGRS